MAVQRISTGISEIDQFLLIFTDLFAYLVVAALMDFLNDWAGSWSSELEQLVSDIGRDASLRDVVAVILDENKVVAIFIIVLVLLYGTLLGLFLGFLPLSSLLLGFLGAVLLFL